MELYRKVRHAYFRQGLSKRRIARDFGLSRDSVDKMLTYSVPPGYRRSAPIRRPKLDGFTALIEQWLEEDLRRPKKQRHTARRIFVRLREEHGFEGGYTIVKDYVREHQRRRREMFVPLHHAPGHAQADFGEAWVDRRMARRLQSPPPALEPRRAHPAGVPQTVRRGSNHEQTNF